MERNSSDNMNTGGTGAGGMGAGSTGGFGGDAGSTGGIGGGSMGGGSMGGSTGGSMGGSTGGTSASEMASNAASAASDRLQQGKEAVTDKLGQLKSKAGDLKSTLADRLEAGANTLRERGQSGQLAGAMGGAGATAGVSDERMQQLSGTAANALQSTATFLREGDLQASIEEQVRTNPGRTLLIALGVGYMLGKALRR